MYFHVACYIFGIAIISNYIIGVDKANQLGANKTMMFYFHQPFFKGSVVCCLVFVSDLGSLGVARSAGFHCDPGGESQMNGCSSKQDLVSEGFGPPI